MDKYTESVFKHIRLYGEDLDVSETVMDKARFLAKFIGPRESTKPHNTALACIYMTGVLIGKPLELSRMIIVAGINKQRFKNTLRKLSVSFAYQYI